MDRFSRMIGIELAFIRMDEALDSHDGKITSSSTVQQSPDKGNRNASFYYRKNPENN